MPEKPSIPLEHDIVFEELTDDQAREAYERNDAKTFGQWLDRQQKKADEHPDSRGRFDLDIRVAKIIFYAGSRDDGRQRLRELQEAIQSEIMHWDALKETDRVRRFREQLQGVIYLAREWSQ